MPITIPAIPDAAPLATFDSDVDLFNNSKAKEIPAKLKAITEELKQHVNTALVNATTTYINDTVVDDLNTALTDIETFTNGLETQINDQLDEFETNLGTYLGVGAGHSVAAVNSALFTGELASGGITYDSDGRLASVAQGPRVVEGITYNDNGDVSAYTEKLTFSGVTYATDYTFTYTPDGKIDAITEA